MKKCICLLLALLLCSSGISSYAQDPLNIYRDYFCCEANVYLCIEESSQVILMNVAPVVKTALGFSAARDVEYLAIDVNPDAIFRKNGGKLSFDDVNGNLLDNKAMVIIGRNGYGYSALYLCIN